MDQWVTSIVHGFGYPGIALLMFAENVFPPIPSELIMPLAGFLAGQGALSFAGVVAAGMVGSVAGAVPLYYLGRLASAEGLKRWVDAHGHWLLVDRAAVERAESWFDRHGTAVVFFARLVPGVRSLISIPAGLCGMGKVRFFLWTAVGTALWAGLLAFVGDRLGARYHQVGTWVGPAAYVVLGLLVAWYLFHALRGHRAKHRGRPGEPAQRR